MLEMEAAKKAAESIGWSQDDLRGSAEYHEHGCRRCKDGRHCLYGTAISLIRNGYTFRNTDGLTEEVIRAEVEDILRIHTGFQFVMDKIGEGKPFSETFTVEEIVKAP